METRQLTCINCPMGCALTVNIINDEITVRGNTCIRGEKYGKDEVTNPTRTVTSTILTSNGLRVSCKTEKAIPKEKIFEVMEVIKKTRSDVPISIGDVLIENVAGTLINVVATKNIK